MSKQTWEGATPSDSLTTAALWVAHNRSVRRLFEAEVSNERQGGVSPATLTSTIDSLVQGGAEVFEMNSNDVIGLLVIRDMVPGKTKIADLLDKAQDAIERRDAVPGEAL